jgi:hypothetical protein
MKLTREFMPMGIFEMPSFPRSGNPLVFNPAPQDQDGFPLSRE